MEQKNQNEFLKLKNYSEFLIDLGLNVSFSYKSNNEIYKGKTKNNLENVKDVDDYIKNWQKKNNYDFISRNSNLFSKNVLLLTEKSDFLNINYPDENQPKLFEKMFSSIGQNIDDFLIINIDLVKVKQNHLSQINEILKMYFKIIKPLMFIDMSSDDLNNFFDIHKLNLNFKYFKIPSISQIIKNESLKRDAWSQLKLIRTRLNGL